MVRKGFPTASSRTNSGDVVSTRSKILHSLVGSFTSCVKKLSWIVSIMRELLAESHVALLYIKPIYPRQILKISNDNQILICGILKNVLHVQQRFGVCIWWSVEGTYSNLTIIRKRYIYKNQFRVRQHVMFESLRSKHLDLVANVEIYTVQSAFFSNVEHISCFCRRKELGETATFAGYSKAETNA